MASDIRKFAFLHTGIGVTVGILLFLQLLAGTAVVFWKELKVWQSADQSAAALPDPLSYRLDPIVRSELARAGDPIEKLDLFLPSGEKPLLQVYAHYRGPDLPQERNMAERFYSAASGETVEPGPNGAAEFLFDLHAHLHLPESISQILLGALGLMMLALLASGLFIHRKVITTLFTFRRDRSLRLKWTDLHNRLGIWALPFHFVIAVTAVPYALHEGPWLTAMMFGAAGGNPEDAKVEKMFSRQWPPARGVLAPLSDVDKVLEAMEVRHRGFSPEWITISHPGDSAARIGVRGYLPGAASRSQLFLFDGSSGAFIEELGDPVGHGSYYGGKIFSLMQSLHTGEFAGVFSKSLWFLLGISSALLAASGQLIWLERQRHKRGLPGWYERLTLGVCAGLPWAMLNTLAGQQIANASGLAPDSGSIAGWCFSISLLLSVGYSFAAGASRPKLRALLALSAFSAASAVAVRCWFLSDTFARAWAEARFTTAGVDIGLLLLAVTLATASRLLPADKRRDAKEAKQPYRIEERQAA